MNEKKISQLLFKQLEGIITEEEKLQLDNWIAANPANRELFYELTNEDLLSAAITEGHPDNRHQAKERIWTKIKLQSFKPSPVVPLHRRSFFKVAVAASIFLVLGLGSYFIYLNKGSEKPPIVKAPETHDVKAPQSTRAMITLANGQRVLLDSLTSGTLAKQGNVNVLKTTDGQIVYNGSANTIEYNTLFNPRGSKVQPLTLNDGTKIWLNSESSIRFPTAFTGNERNVEITGEAYFEVTKDAAKKFIVAGNGVTTEVLGTHFNVNTYADESAMKVTLLEGSVKVVKGTAINILKPGQQAQIGNDIKIISAVDIDEVMAWKNGRFQFNKASLQEVMRQIARWYDVEIVYEGKIAPQQFGGKMQRDLKLSEVLDGLAKSQVHFRIEGKKVVVTQ